MLRLDGEGTSFLLDDPYCSFIGHKIVNWLLPVHALGSRMLSALQVWADVLFRG